MIRLSRALLALAVTCALSACQQPATPSAPAASAPAASTPAPERSAPAPTAAPAPAATPAATATASAGSIGIAECDDYLNKYQACVESKVPEGSRAALVQGLDQTRAAWRSAIATPGGKESLAAACKQMHDATKASMGAYGCNDF